MAKYRKRPVVIEAIRYSGPNLDEIKEFVDGRTELAQVVGGITIYTLEGPMQASVGDYIIKGFKGEFYPCKPDIFEATYTKVEEDAT